MLSANSSSSQSVDDRADPLTYLDEKNCQKFLTYVGLCALSKPFGTIYFYGTGGNGKSTFCYELETVFPDLFGCNGSITIYNEGMIDSTVKLPAPGEGSAIVQVNSLPEGIHPSRVIHFNRRF